MGVSVHGYMGTCVHGFMDMSVWKHECLCVWVYVRMCVCAYVCMLYVCGCMRVWDVCVRGMVRVDDRALSLLERALNWLLLTLILTWGNSMWEASNTYTHTHLQSTTLGWKFAESVKFCLCSAQVS